MTTTRDKLGFIADYKAWAEEQELGGKPNGVDDYGDYLEAREPIEKLERIRDRVMSMGKLTPASLEGFYNAVRAIVGLPREIEQ